MITTPYLWKLQKYVYNFNILDTVYNFIMVTDTLSISAIQLSRPWVVTYLANLQAGPTPN
jgi:hypothetical protein